MEIEIDRYLKMKERRGRKWFQSNRIVKIVSDGEGCLGDRRKVERRDQEDVRRIRSVDEYDTNKVEERGREVVRFSSKRIVHFPKSIDRKSSKKRCYIDLCEDAEATTCQQGTSYNPM